MRILVTGGTGFIGSNLVKGLLKFGHEVWATGSLSRNPLPKEVTVFEHGLIGLDWSEICSKLNGEKIDILFHQAANNDTTVTDFDAMHWANVQSAIMTFEKASAVGCRKFIYASSTAVYGDTPAPYKEDGPKHPLNAYAASKLRLEYLAQGLANIRSKKKIVTIGLRYCNVYGPGEAQKGKRASMVYQLAQQIRAGKQPKLFGDGEQRRDYIFVDDVVRANILAMELNETCVINCGTGQATSFNELVQMLRMTIPTTDDYGWEEPAYIPNPYADAYQNFTQCDMTKAREIMGFIPKYGIQEGIAKYYERGGL